MAVTSITNAMSEGPGGTESFRALEQGGRVLSVIKPRVHGGPVYHGTEEDLER